MKKKLHVKASTRKKIRALLLIILVVLVGIFFLKLHARKNEMPDPNVPAIVGDTDNLISFSVAPGAEISGMVMATGSLRGNYFFEANAQGMLLDSTKNIVSRFQLTATSEWMTTDGVAFKATIDTSGAPKGPGYIRLQNDNPSGDSARDKYVDIPVIFG